MQSLNVILTISMHIYGALAEVKAHMIPLKLIRHFLLKQTNKQTQKNRMEPRFQKSLWA